MNKIKERVIQTIKDIPDEEITTFEELMEAVETRYQAMQGLKDVESGNIMTVDELKEDVANWK